MTAPLNAAPQLVLVAEATAAGEALLAALLAEAPPACVILAPEGGLALLGPDDAEPAAARPLDIDCTRRLVAVAQAANVATLLAGDPAAAIETGADGLHLDHTDDIADRFQAMRRLLGPSATIGVTAGLSRHDAMVLGEAGADYIAFDLRPGAEPGAIDMIAWWAEIFEIPVVAVIAPDMEAARAALAAGADFLTVCPPAAADVAAMLAPLRELRTLLCEPPATGSFPV